MIALNIRASSFVSRCYWVFKRTNTTFYGHSTMIQALSPTIDNRESIATFHARFSSLQPQQDLQVLLPQQSPKFSSRKPVSCKKIRSLQEFVDRIPAALRSRKISNVEPGAVDDPVARLFRSMDISPHIWQKYALFDSKKPYTRNLISTDHKNYTLLLLCWNPEQESPIHDHPCDGCWLKVLDGGIREVRYDRQLNPFLQIDCQKGELSYITDNVGYHKVGNPTKTPAVTLHLYAPPFHSCRCWHSERDDPLEPSDGKTVNHSEYGILTTA